MIRLKTLFLTLFFGLILSFNASAWWGGGPWNYNAWPVWTPMYWMEEMSDEWGGNDYWGGPWGHGGYPYGGYPYGGYGYPYGGYPYGGLPYGGYGGFPGGYW